jgi:hypothetical protein
MLFLVRIVQEAVWIPGPVWMGAENFAPPGPDPPTAERVATQTTLPRPPCPLRAKYNPPPPLYNFRVGGRFSSQLLHSWREYKFNPRSLHWGFLATAPGNWEAGLRDSTDHSPFYLALSFGLFLFPTHSTPPMPSSQVTQFTSLPSSYLTFLLSLPSNLTSLSLFFRKFFPFILSYFYSLSSFPTSTYLHTY